MTRFLQSDDNPSGFTLEDILMVLRADVLKRSVKIAHDDRPEAQRVMANNVKILLHLTEAAELARDSTQTLGPVFAPAVTAEDEPQVGLA